MIVPLATGLAGGPPPVDSEHVDISVVIPCLSEELGIGWTVDRAFEGLQASRHSGEVLVVDNGSEDRSVEVAEAHGARVIHEPKQGYGSAYQRGLAEARGEVVVMGDGDATYDFSLLPRFVTELELGASLVMGARSGFGSMPFLHRYLGNPAISRIFSWWFGLRLVDAYSGMRAFRKQSFPVHQLRAPGMEFALEMLVFAARAHLPVAEVPIPYYPRLGTSKLRTWRDGWRSLKFLLLSSPDALLIIPGAVATFAGIILLLLTLMADLGFPGRLLWSPSFSSGFCLFVGLQGLAFGSSLRAHLTIGTRPTLVDAVFQSIFERSRGTGVAFVLILAGFLAQTIPVQGLFKGALAQLLVMTGSEILLWVVFAAALKQAGWFSRSSAL